MAEIRKGSLAMDCIAQAVKEIKRLKGFLFLSLGVNLILAAMIFCRQRAAG